MSNSTILYYSEKQDRLLIKFLGTIVGGNLNQISRMELMQKLSRSDKPAIDLPKAPM